MGAVLVELTDSNVALEGKTRSFKVERRRLLRKSEVFQAWLARWSRDLSDEKLQLEVPEAQHVALQTFLCGGTITDVEALLLADTADAYCLDPLLGRIADLRAMRRAACMNCRLMFAPGDKVPGPCQPLTPWIGDPGGRCGLCHDSRNYGCGCRMPMLAEHVLSPC
jgi:hypothetical protein